jgi:hypothetical protein
MNIPIPNIPNVPIPKKRGPKSKKIKQQEEEEQQEDRNKHEEQEEKQQDENELLIEKIPKKRGRKPKGGKIINSTTTIEYNKNVEENKSFLKPNIILHLKCFLSDIDNDETINNPVSFNFTKDKTSYEYIQNDNVNPELLKSSNNETNQTINDINHNTYYSLLKNSKDSEENESSDDENNLNVLKHSNKEIFKKLKQLEINLHLNNCFDKKASCFWDTYDFDNPAIYIPMCYSLNNTINVYGCFCSPECACAYLMNENLDNATKFERYQLLNHIYTKIYNYKKKIKPAPNPYYTLNKYYGNLNIQKYRSLLQNERLFLIVDKPLTRIMPELIEDNDEYILNKKLIPCNTSTKTTFQIKKKNQKKTQTKNNILNENFGLNTEFNE